MSRERLDSAADAAQSFHPRGAEVIIRMQGLPYDCTSEEVVFVYKHLLNNSFKIFAIFFLFRTDGIFSAMARAA